MHYVELHIKNDLESEDIQSVFVYSAELVSGEKVFPIKVSA